MASYSSPLPVITALPVPNFADLAKASNDLLTKDFYHLSAAAIEVKSNTPNDIAFKVNGKSTHEHAKTGTLEAKYTDKPNGLTVTQTWSTLNVLDTKIEVKDKGLKGLKAEAVGNFFPAKLSGSAASSEKSPAASSYGAKLNLHYQNSMVHGRALFDLMKGPTANIDAVIGQDGYLVGGSVSYDVNKAAVTNFSAAVGYATPIWSASVLAQNKLAVFSACYYHKVNSMVEAGAKATWDSKTGDHVGLELASKYRFDPLSFAKAKINDRGVASVSYNVLLNTGVTLGVGASFDTQKLDQATHKIGAELKFDA